MNMKKNESLLNNDLIKDFRNNLRFTDIKDKIICFVPEWDDYNFLNFPRDIEWKNIIFFLNQENIFQKIHFHLNNNSCLEFIATQEISSENDFFKELGNQNLKKAFKNIDLFNNQAAKKQGSGNLFNAYLSGINRLNSLTKNAINVFPNDKPFNINPNKTKTIKSNIKILCLDYELFNGKLIYKFLDFSEHYLQQKKLSSEKLNNKQYRFFSELNPLLIINFWVKASEIINKLKKGSFNDEDSSEISFLSKNNLQNIKKPLFWSGVEENGFIFKKINNTGKTNTDNKMIDVRFFYSFGHLLFFELAKMIIGGRCRSCGKLLPKNYKGLYCPKSNKKCALARNREKQRKHYTKLKTLTRS